MAVSALGVAHLVALTARAHLAARSQTSTAILALQKMEQLRSLAWGYEDGPGGQVGAPIADAATDVTVDPPTSSGFGLRPSPGDTLAANTAGYVDYLSASGTWLGTGSPPQGAAYIRRWSIQPLAAAPHEALVLQVRVIAAYEEAARRPRDAGEAGRGAGAGGPSRRYPAETLLVSLKTRRGM